MGRKIRNRQEPICICVYERQGSYPPKNLSALAIYFFFPQDRVPMHIIALKTSVHVEVAEKLHATNRKVFHFAVRSLYRMLLAKVLKWACLGRNFCN